MIIKWRKCAGWRMKQLWFDDGKLCNYATSLPCGFRVQASKVKRWIQFKYYLFRFNRYELLNSVDYYIAMLANVVLHLVFALFAVFFFWFFLRFSGVAVAAEGPEVHGFRSWPPQLTPTSGGILISGYFADRYYYFNGSVTGTSDEHIHRPISL